MHLNIPVSDHNKFKALKNILFIYTEISGFRQNMYTKLDKIIMYTSKILHTFMF